MTRGRHDLVLESHDGARDTHHAEYYTGGYSEIGALATLAYGSGRKEFFRYEARLTGVVASLPAVIFCLYDLQRFGAEVLMDTLRTHPMVVVDGVVHDNPYYVDPGEFLRGPE